MIDMDEELQAALDALRAAVLWLDGDYVDKPREEFNREAWGRRARRGIDALARLEARVIRPGDPDHPAEQVRAAGNG